jgi:hypothetical protein
MPPGRARSRHSNSGTAYLFLGSRKYLNLASRLPIAPVTKRFFMKDPLGQKENPGSVWGETFSGLQLALFEALLSRRLGGVGGGRGSHLDRPTYKRDHARNGESHL